METPGKYTAQTFCFANPVRKVAFLGPLNELVLSAKGPWAMRPFCRKLFGLTLAKNACMVTCWGTLLGTYPSVSTRLKVLGGVISAAGPGSNPSWKRFGSVLNVWRAVECHSTTIAQYLFTFRSSLLYFISLPSQSFSDSCRYLAFQLDARDIFLRPLTPVTESDAQMDRALPSLLKPPSNPTPESPTFYIFG